MSPSHFKVKSLSGNIFSSVLVFALALIMVFGVVMTSIYYYSYEHDAEAKLSALASDAAKSLNETSSEANIPVLREQFAGMVRYTLIANDGTVLFDSVADEGSLGDHHERPEVLEADATGASTVVRYSETLKTDTVYAAVKLSDGSIIRLAETRESLAAFLGSMIAPLAAALVLVSVAVFFLSKTLTRRIMKPIDALNFAEPLENEIYEEMDPLLERIDEQQRMLKQQTREIARAETMRRDFSSNVSHEMKTPLQVISGYAELMKNGLVDPADSRKFAGLIYEEAQAMRSLINDVLILSRLDEAAVGDRDQAIDLYAMAQSVANRLVPFSDSEGVRVLVEGESTCIAGTDTLAEEMLYNLVENGIRYNHEGGSVRVIVGNDGAGPVVRVTDTGVGIPEEMHDKVFERFFRVDKSRSKETGGTGLGLAIVKHAVMYHGGSIEVKSTLGEGTTFILRFPAMDERAN